MDEMYLQIRSEESLLCAVGSSAGLLSMRERFMMFAVKEEINAPP